jgi:uncharacterized membrane protein
MFVPWSIILQAGGAVKPGWRTPVLWTSLILVGVLLVGALLITLVDRWRKRASSRTATPAEQLSHFRRLYDRGELSAEEFERIKTLLGGKLRQDLHVPGAPPPRAPEGPARSPDTRIQNGPPSGTP